MDKVYKEISIREMEGIIEPTIHDRLSKESYQIFRTQGVNLLTYSRFDLAFKLYFLETFSKNSQHAAKVYLEHIRAFSFGSFKEPNNEDKNSKSKFIDTFLQLSNDISNIDFDPNKSILPLSKNGFILNGAHRLASAINSKKEVFYINTSDEGTSFTYNFFYERNVSETYLDMAATMFAKKDTHTFIALVWPSAKSKDTEIENILDKVVYKKNVFLNLNGAHNLMSKVYKNEKWLGTIEDDFKGTKPKVMECFKNIDNPLRAYLFQADTLEEVLKKKDDIRDVFNIDKHSIHITDTHEEVVELSKLLFNNNSIHFLNNAKPNTFITFHKKLDKFKRFVSANEINAEDIILDSGMVLSLYGIRKSDDIDYIINDRYSITSDDSGINSHNSEINFYNKASDELLYNSENYFYFNDIKFISFNQLYLFKKNRNGEKDRNDLLLMDAVSEKDSKKMKSAKMKQKMFYLKHRIKYAPIILSIKLLKKIGMYDSIRQIYHRLKN